MQLFDPRIEKMVEVVDIRAEALEVTVATDVPSAVVEGFKAHRRAMLATRAARGFFAKIISFFSALLSKGCKVPESVALGTYFGDQLRKDGFDAEVTIYWYVVCPQYLKGSSQNLVYLTSTNMAAPGAEGLVSYYADGEAVFCVFESDLTLVRSWPWSNQLFQDHLITKTINAKSYSTLYIANKTSGANNKWKNEVFLYDAAHGTFDLVWDSSYDFDPSTAESLCWAPIIETPRGGEFGTTNMVGYADATLVVGLNGSTKTVLLDTNNSDFVGTPARQFDKEFLLDNYTLLAD